ncbi:hypothetical protein PTSG_11889 [Salpingoeca rosetta]|uniref:Palmitoyltransferase n=1 Tax=Salpingoeca rosetta (strain ATCC 50818 / BSB-021) TaxID=946362 RepID=F2U2G6_SALR5|nr:uncharacterized protein PTSG_11889 [Salpingoeca rosetta]EGD81818.1 hypothetical protein PTSG_11889 [Salpingoeca rosetta]|eukprot:XP_004997022.1 hypothetical protein PTSG_11889 [Salpingoeca rosetta]
MATQSVFGWGPLVALGLIVLIAYATTYCHQVGKATLWSDALFVTWVTTVVVVLYSFFKSIYVGPGFVPLKWRPKDEANIERLTYCHICEGYKAPRSHHCRQCGRCVKVLDHHCPWINSCVGNDNKVYFLLFVTSVPIGCVYSAVKCVLFLIRYYQTMFSVQHARYFGYRLTPGRFAFVICGGAAALGVALAVAMLAVIQIKSILKNKTDIEGWIDDKAKRVTKKSKTPFIFPYDLGWRNNIKEVMRQSVRRDGINWAVREGCTNYDMSQAQLWQKRTHAQYRYTFKVKTRPGRWGWRMGWRILCSCPWTQATIDLQPGDLMHAWRQRGKWYCGEKVRVENGMIRTVYPLHRGWFPIAAVEEVDLQLPYDYRGDGLFLQPPPTANDDDDNSEGGDDEAEQDEQGKEAAQGQQPRQRRANGQDKQQKQPQKQPQKQQQTQQQQNRHQHQAQKQKENKKRK